MRRLVWLVLFLISSPAGAITLTDKFHSYISKGNSYFEEGSHQKALEMYQKARSVDSTRATAYFNEGDALYRLGRFKDCVKAFSRSTRALPETTSAWSYYNLGNSLFRLGDLRGACEAYKKALFIDPNDQDAKYNLELVMKMLEEKQQQSTQNKQKEKQTDKQKEQGGKKESQPEREKERDEERKESGEPSQERQMTPEELERILAAIDASDREVQKQIFQKARRRRLTAKDW